MKKYRYTREELVKLLQDHLDVFIAGCGDDSPSSYLEGIIDAYQYVLSRLEEKL